MGIIELLVVLLGIVALVAWIYAVYLFVRRAEEKNPKMESSGFLWLVGIFASPIVLGLYVISMKDMSAEKTGSGVSHDELPSV